VVSKNPFTAEIAENAEKIYKFSAFSVGSAVKALEKSFFGTPY
jgi:hypothetical protein